MEALIIYSQENFPHFLEGKWKMEGQDSYELWTKHGSYYLKGISYSIKNGQFELSEYLEIRTKGKEIYYGATVLNQNEGKEIEFKLRKKDSIYYFYNPEHSFPSIIKYHLIKEDKIEVELSDGCKMNYKFNMLKQKVVTKDSSIKNKNYDAELAAKLGADELGMRSYFLVILKTGSNTTTDKDIVQNSFRGHMDNIQRLVKEGKLIIAGPFLAKNANNYRGIFILNTKTIEETESLLQSDPAIKNKIFDVEIYPWYGSAALPEYLPAADKLWKEKP